MPGGQGPKKAAATSWCTLWTFVLPSKERVTVKRKFSSSNLWRMIPPRVFLLGRELTLPSEEAS